MKRLLFVLGVVVLAAPMFGTLYAQDDSIDITNILGDRGGGGRGGGGNRGPQIPDSMTMFNDIKSTLNKGKTPLDKAQEKPLRSLLDTEITMLSDKVQVLRNGNNNNNNNNNNGFPGGDGGGGGRGGRGGRGGGGDQANQGNNTTQTAQQQQTAQQAQIETLTSLKNDDFIETKLQLFLSPEQVALVKKAKADDKNNSTCLGGLLDRVSQQLQNRNNNNNQNRGNGNFNNNNNNNNSNNKSNGQKYCMAADVTPSQRLEPIRKVLANGKLPLTADKEPLAEVVMTAQIGTLETSLRTSLTGNQGNRGNNNNNKLPQLIQSSTDAIYKKVEAMLNPMQAETLTKWHYTQMLGRNPVDTLIAVNAMQDTPLSEDQIAKVTVAWTEYRSQIQDAAKKAGKSVSAKDLDGATMEKILGMLDPPQVASYKLAIKYGPQAVSQ